MKVRYLLFYYLVFKKDTKDTTRRNRTSSKTNERILQRKGERKMKNTKSLDQLKSQYYGDVGTPERDRIERELEALRIGFKLRSAREQQNLTQEEVAKRINKKRTFISKVETDGENITLKTLFDVVERGLGGRLKISVEF